MSQSDVTNRRLIETIGEGYSLPKDMFCVAYTRGQWFRLSLMQHLVVIFDKLSDVVLRSTIAALLILPTLVSRKSSSTEQHRAPRVPLGAGLRPLCPLLSLGLVVLGPLFLVLPGLTLGSLFSRLADRLWSPEAVRLLQSRPVTGQLASMTYWPAIQPTNGSGALFDPADSFSNLFEGDD